MTGSFPGNSRQAAVQLLRRAWNATANFARTILADN
jgi:hypothetical protein